MNKAEKDKIEKQLKIDELLPYAFGIHEFKFFDIDSDKLLDEKIEVLEAIKEGKSISEIPKVYDVLELMPKEGIWD